MAPAILFPLTDDMAGALRATLNTRLHEVELHLRAVPPVYGDDLRGVYVDQLRTLLAGLEGSISKSLRKFSAGASDDCEVDFGEPKAGLLKSGEDGVNLAQGGDVLSHGFPHEALSEFLIAENGSVEQLADWATKHGQGVFARLGTLEDALKSQVAATARLARKLGLSEADIADCTAQARAALTTPT